VTRARAWPEEEWSLATSGSLTGPRRAERAFFGGMAALIAVTILLGFARTYYLRPLVGATSPPLSNLTPLIHVHGLLFTGWIVLLVAQTRLVAAGRIDAHRRLGIAGAVLAALMTVASSIATAQPYPARPIRLLTLTAAGSGSVAGCAMGALSHGAPGRAIVQDGDGARRRYGGGPKRQGRDKPGRVSQSISAVWIMP